jgi:hypothetical protein
VWSRILRGLEGDPGRAGPAASLLGRVAAASLLILMTATWQLWSVTTFPRVPLVGALLRLPGWVEWTALAAFAAAQLVALIWGFDRRAGRRGVAISVLALGVLVLADQHRLQPWVYQLLVLEIVLAGLPAAEAIAVARLLVASIYFYSALSKLDRSFFESGGGQIVDGLLESLRLTGSVTDGNRAVLAGIVVLGELLVALGLCWRRARRYAWLASIALHALLLLALGPLGAGNKPGVLLWNLYFIAQNVILFGWAGELSVGEQATATASQQGHEGIARWAIRGLALFVLLFPLTEPLGICDVWPAWAVYATGPERARVFVAAADRGKLPEAARDYLQPPRFEDDLCLLRIDRWSLDASGSPLYPQNRFRLGVALALDATAAIGDGLVVELDGPADRFTGKRTSRRLQGRVAIAVELERDWLNGFPREH